MKFKSANGLTSLLKEGYKHFGGLEEAILKNIEACKGLAAITRTSLGPNGEKRWMPATTPSSRPRAARPARLWRTRTDGSRSMYPTRRVERISERQNSAGRERSASVQPLAVGESPTTNRLTSDLPARASFPRPACSLPAPRAQA